MAKARAFGTIRQLPSGRYQARYRHLGRQIAAETTFANKGDARAWLAAVETDLRRGVHIGRAPVARRFDDYADEWLDGRPLRPRTREVYRSQLKHITPTFDRAFLSEITAYDVRQWHGRLVKSGLDRNTAAKVYRLFRTIMTTAVEDGLVRVNPVSIKGAATERTAERPLLDWSQVERLAALIEPRFSALVWTAAVSGLRFGELTALDRHRVNLDTCDIRVDRALGFVKGAGPSMGPPKSNAAHRVVAIPPQTRDLLRAHLESFAESRPNALVFTSVKGCPLLNRYFAPFWHRAKTEAQVDQTIRFHDLRHLAGTEAASAGASLREIMARLGPTQVPRRFVT